MKRSPYRDDVTANTYDHIALPYQFAAPARDLVAMLRLPAGGRVLDVGTGTGAAAIPAAEVVGIEGTVIALDASVEMLRLLQRKEVCRVVAGEVPGLPILDGFFHAVMGNFVVSHFKSYASGLADMIRVLRPGGRLGVTAWAAGSNQFGKAWSDVAATFVNSEILEHAFREIIPWDEWLSQEGKLQQALEDAGFIHVEVTRRTYRIAMNVTDYLSLREGSVEGNLLRRNLEPDQWRQFRERVREVFRDRFSSSVEYSRDVFFGIGTKPASTRD
jgi:ubiquinone/menaquinone biosynthesis C-methylase UbiE